MLVFCSFICTSFFLFARAMRFTFTFELLVSLCLETGRFVFIWNHNAFVICGFFDSNVFRKRVKCKREEEDERRECHGIVDFAMGKTFRAHFYCVKYNLVICYVDKQFVAKLPIEPITQHFVDRPNSDISTMLNTHTHEQWVESSWDHAIFSRAHRISLQLIFFLLRLLLRRHSIGALHLMILFTQSAEWIKQPEINWNDLSESMVCIRFEPHFKPHWTSKSCERKNCAQNSMHRGWNRLLSMCVCVLFSSFHHY